MREPGPQMPFIFSSLLLLKTRYINAIFETLSRPSTSHDNAKKQIVYNSFKVLILLEAICRAICSKPSLKYYMSFDIFSHNFENTHSIFTIQHDSFCPNFERSFGDCFALTFNDMIFSAILHSCTCMY